MHTIFKAMATIIFSGALLLSCAGRVTDTGQVTATAVAPSAGAWQLIGPGGGMIVSVVADPADADTLYTLVNCGGVRKSTDGGQTWQAQDRGLRYDLHGQECQAGTALAVHPANPNVLLRSAHSGEIYFTRDAAETWQITYQVPGDNFRRFCCFTFDPDNPNVVYTAIGDNNRVLTEEYELFDVTGNFVLRGEWDGQQWRWTKISEMEGHDTEIIYSMDVGQENGRTYLYLTTNAGLYKGEVVGDSFTPLEISAPGLPADEYLEGANVVVDDHTPGRVYLAVGNRADLYGGVYRSTDYAASFTLLTDPDGYDPWNQGRPNTRFFTFLIDPHDPAVLYASQVKYNPKGESGEGGTLFRSPGRSRTPRSPRGRSDPGSGGQRSGRFCGWIFSYYCKSSRSRAGAATGIPSVLDGLCKSRGTPPAGARQCGT
ncbi:MAG: hypothetical protein QMD04_06115 [Anaerolineales bacterium]|nr:hypothetical protein [Anaerolineales bacterium]